MNIRNSFESRKILVVDDDHLCIEITKDILESQGVDVHFAYNGKEALGKFNQQSYDMILIDYEMPIMNGLEFLKHISRIQDRETPPILMISGSCNDDLGQLAINFGAKGFLYKPIDREMLLNKIEAYFQLS